MSRLSGARFALLIGVLGAMPGLIGSSRVSATSTVNTYYFHGGLADSANRTLTNSSATFSPVQPTGKVGAIQTAPQFANPDFAGNPLGINWTGTFSGSVSGNLSLNWFWSSRNPAAVISGDDVTVSVFADPAVCPTGGVQPAALIGRATVHLKLGATPVRNLSNVPVNGTVGQMLMIQVTAGKVPNLVDNTVHYDSVTANSSFSVAVSPLASTPGFFANYSAPLPMAHRVPSPLVVGFLCGEPSIGADWQTGKVMYQGQVSTYRVGFDDTQKPPVATWKDATATSEQYASADARLITDHTGKIRKTGDRTIVTQLAGEQSISAYTDNDGKSPNGPDWISQTSGGIVSGVDHESIGAGPYHTLNGKKINNPVYPHAVYYCSQADLSAFCARSDDGGLSYGLGVTVYESVASGGGLPQCGGLHGRPYVGPDGTVYLPNKNCGGQKGVIVSKDNGLTWTIHRVPGSSTDPNQSDPDLAVGANNTLYYGYRDGDHHAKVAISTDAGNTFATVDVGALGGIQNAQFPVMLAGDDNRAAFSFIGTTTAGDDLPDAFPCIRDPNDATKCNPTGPPAVWDLYVAFTFDRGQTWHLVDATPSDPVQRGGVCMKGVACGSAPSASDRNMLDFNDGAIDQAGRVLVAYTDGCVGLCETSANGNGTFASNFAMVRQVCGRGLFAAYDPGFNNLPNCPASF
jgi:hypothetical protein